MLRESSASGESHDHQVSAAGPFAQAYAEYADYTAQPDKSIERLTAYAANYSMNVRYGLFLNPAFQGSSTSRNQVKALLTNCLKSSSLDTEIDGLFKTAYDNTMKEMGE